MKIIVFVIGFHFIVCLWILGFKDSKMSKKICQYLIYTFTITYLFWGFDIILSRVGLYEHPTYNIGMIFYVIAVCAPAISGYIVMQNETDKSGICYFIKSSFKFNQPVLEILLICIFMAIRFGIPFLFGDISIIGNWWKVVVFTPIMLLFGGFEEIGWRGYLQPKLEKKFGFFVATLINCAIWIVWHIPLCFMKGTYQYSGNYLWFAVSLVGSAFSLAAINKVRGSIIPCILFHSICNAIVSYGISINEGVGIAISTCIQIIFAACIFILCNKTTMADY